MFGPMSHMIAGMDHVWEREPSNKLVGTQVNDARTKDANVCKPGSKLEKQPFALKLEQRKSGFVFMTHSEMNWDGT